MHSSLLLTVRIEKFTAVVVVEGFLLFPFEAVLWCRRILFVHKLDTQSTKSPQTCPPTRLCFALMAGLDVSPLPPPPGAASNSSSSSNVSALSGGLSAGAITGIALGGAVSFLIILTSLALCWRFFSKHHSQGIGVKCTMCTL